MPNLRILLVEDDGMISMLMTMMLEEMGFTVCATACSEADAIREAERTLPDLIVTDVNLEEGSGTAAIATICRRRPTPHVFVSADADGARGMNPNALVLEKPFHYADLERAIGHAMHVPHQPAAAARGVAARPTPL